MSITFQLPANDAELVDQVYNHIEDSAEYDSAETLLSMSRKYRFAGYIGSFDYLFVKFYELTEEIKILKAEIEKLKKPKKSSWW